MDLNRHQFPPPGDADAKARLLEQLRADFPEPALAWLRDPAVTVDAPQRINPAQVDWDDYSEWRASRQLKGVLKIAKKLNKGKGKHDPAVMVQPPDSDQLTIIDGHHHTMGAVDAKKKPKTWVVHVPETTGPWLTMHDHQINDTRKDDFGKTGSYDRND